MYDNNGFYAVSEQYEGAPIRCEDFICVTEYDGTEHTKDCRINE